MRLNPVGFRGGTIACRACRTTTIHGMWCSNIDEYSCTHQVLTLNSPQSEIPLHAVLSSATSATKAKPVQQQSLSCQLLRCLSQARATVGRSKGTQNYESARTNKQKQARNFCDGLPRAVPSKAKTRDETTVGKSQYS